MVKQPEKEIVKELSDEAFGLKLDCCFADTALKIASGAAIGTVFSIVFSRAKKTWPIWLGTGIGIGMGWSNCKHVLRNPPNWRFSKKWGKILIVVLVVLLLQ
ncbi:MICOS complex subunit MIC10 [Meloidogyne graminicola]|uniref:MICOS complex subunit MIC10 n=1 Tax=Meloidogyne graminicola TaxID=189291 RepID=A0A8S9ZEP4_9BILA|nr:MICOS complex subunit MIC10 [Meloidogyne graminicola]